MKNGLWAGLNRRYRARLRQRMGERGAAMMLAVLFVMVVLTTSALVMTILLSQALPYRNNKENAQVGYAAESGLEVALSFLREAEASKDYKKLLPSTASNTGNASLDETFTTASDGSVLLNNAEVSNDVSATGVSSFTPDDISYRVQIIPAVVAGSDMAYASSSSSWLLAMSWALARWSSSIKATLKLAGASATAAARVPATL